MARKKRKLKRGTRQSTINRRRKGLLAFVIPWMKRFGFAMVVLLGVIWISSWLYLSGSLARAGDWTEDKILKASADMGFAVDNILVEGREHSDASVLLAMINIEKGDPLFSFNPEDAQELIAQMGWVDEVRVERRWPDTIYVGLKERQPMALWQSEKRLKLLDQSGQVIVTNDLQRFADLIMVSGEGAPEETVALIGNLKAQPEIYDAVETASWVGARRWDLRLKNGIHIRLPEEDAALAIRRLAEAHAQDDVLNKDVKTIDLREGDRISILTKSGTTVQTGSGLKIEAKAGNNI